MIQQWWFWASVAVFVLAGMRDVWRLLRSDMQKPAPVISTLGMPVILIIAAVVGLIAVMMKLWINIRDGWEDPHDDDNYVRYRSHW